MNIKIALAFFFSVFFIPGVAWAERPQAATPRMKKTERKTKPKQFLFSFLFLFLVLFLFFYFRYRLISGRIVHVCH